ncbi:hypothetical protein DSECCO2_580420 [anaerobic digester metagenome]
MLREPEGKVDAGALLRRSLPGEESGDMPEPIYRHDGRVRGRGEDLCPAVGALGGVVALSRYGAVEFPYPGGVVVCSVDRHVIV